MTQEMVRKYNKPIYIKRWLKGRPKARWKDEVENDIRKMRIDNWRQIVQDRDGWRRAMREALILLG
jgi:hypothetical protein